MFVKKKNNEEQMDRSEWNNMRKGPRSYHKNISSQWFNIKRMENMSKMKIVVLMKGFCEET
jgi:hypothetical protein